MNKKFKNKVTLIGIAIIAIGLAVLISDTITKGDTCVLESCVNRCVGLPSGYISSGNPNNYKYEDCLNYWCYGSGYDADMMAYQACLQKEEQNSNQKTNSSQTECVTPTEQCNVDCSRYLGTPEAYTVCVDGCNSQVTQECWDTYNKCMKDKQKQSGTKKTNQQTGQTNNPVTDGTKTKIETSDNMKAKQKILDCKGVTPTGTLTTYKGSRFIGKPVNVDPGFVSSLERLNLIAEDYGVKIVITSSYRNPNKTVKGAIVEPASRSNHMVGHAIDFNVMYKDKLCNSKCLKNLSTAPQAVQDFIDGLRADPALRWGGDFKTPDVVHIDDGMNIDKPQEYEILFKNLNCPKK